MGGDPRPFSEQLSPALQSALLPSSPPDCHPSPPDLVLGISRITSSEFCFWAVSSCVFSPLYFLTKSPLYQQENLLWESSSSLLRPKISLVLLVFTVHRHILLFIGEKKKVLFLKAGFSCQLLYKLMVRYQVIHHPCWTQIHSLWYKQSGWESVSLVVLQPLRCCDSTHLLWVLPTSSPLAHLQWH